jgi:protein-tyrosine phosphatase
MGIFGNLFGKRKNHPVYPALSDYSAFVTDIHSHLIPGIDDGCKTIEESVSLIQSLAELGFKKLVTTPHIMGDFYKNTPEVIFDGLEKLKAAVAAKGIHISIEAAAEYYLDEEFLILTRQKKLLTIDSKYVLFEISFINQPDSLTGAIFDLIVNGYTPLLAHPERYPFWFQKPEEYKNLKDAGVLFQLNTNSLTGYYGDEVKKTAQMLVDENMVDFIGSDLHHAKHLAALHEGLHSKYLWKLAATGVKNRWL